MSTRFDERLSERTRIARDLHDTFLQTIQGSKLIADSALKQPPISRGCVERWNSYRTGWDVRQKRAGSPKFVACVHHRE